MADEADIANDLADLERERAIREARQFHHQPGIGVCINCGVDVEGERRWCSKECMDDYIKYAKR